MFEVIGNDSAGYKWQFITASGRVIAYSSETYLTELSAASAANDFRCRVAALGEDVDCDQYKGCHACHG